MKAGWQVSRFTVSYLSCWKWVFKDLKDWREQPDQLKWHSYTLVLSTGQLCESRHYILFTSHRFVKKKGKIPKNSDASNLLKNTGAMYSSHSSSNNNTPLKSLSAQGCELIQVFGSRSSQRAPRWLCLCWCSVSASRRSAASEPPAVLLPPGRQSAGSPAAAAHRLPAGTAAAEVSLLDGVECSCCFPHCWNSTPACLLVPAWLLPSLSPFPFYLLFFLSFSLSLFPCLTRRSTLLAADCLLNSHLSHNVLLLFFYDKVCHLCHTMLLKMCV